MSSAIFECRGFQNKINENFVIVLQKNSRHVTFINHKFSKFLILPDLLHKLLRMMQFFRTSQRYWMFLQKLSTKLKIKLFASFCCLLYVYVLTWFVIFWQPLETKYTGSSRFWTIVSILRSKQYAKKLPENLF